MIRNLSRRSFIKTSAAASTVYSLIPHTALGANERVNVGIVGCGWKGGAHINDFKAAAAVVAVSDADTDRMQKGGSAKKFRDMRGMLDLPEIDAIVVATPNHWHCLAGIWAMQAGKHVYVEKPVSHHIWEGRKLVGAARKYGRVCQAGTQQRSCPAPAAAARDIRDGRYGKVLWVHCRKLDARSPIGKVGEAVPPPASVDYELWAGPGPKVPVMRKQFHYDWHWQFNWGDGEMGNWGVHYIDDLRHILGWDDIPQTVVAAGNRFWDDDGNTPNMHFALMEHDGVKVVVDIRNMQDARGGKSGAVYLGSRQGNYIHCENGHIQIARGGGAGYDAAGQRIARYKGDGGRAHIQNFLAAVKANDPGLLNCDVEIGHKSTAMCHLANIAWRVGVQAPVEEVREVFSSHEDAVKTLESMLSQLEYNKVDLKQTPFVLGPKLTFDNSAENFIGAHAEEANRYLALEMRQGFEIPEQV